jgi:4-hydroxy-4-methyl-2-oxoglutarate aldolase
MAAKPIDQKTNMADNDTKRNAAQSTSIAERFSSFDPATLFEAAGRQGMIDPAVRPAWRGAKICGVAATVECPPGDNLMLHMAVAEAEEEVVLVANAGSYLLAGAWGEVLTVAAQARGILGLVIDGAVRDIDAIERLGFPIFSRGLAIGACTKERPGTLNRPVQIGGATVRPGDIIVGHSDGLVVVDQNRAEEVYENATSRQQREEEMIRQLRQGRTTVELLGLARFGHQ